MESVIAVFAPGQGAQSPGMFVPWLELPGVEEQIGGFSEATGLDLLRLGTTAGADEIKDTAVTQPLLVALGVIAAAHLGLEEAGERVVAGHSVGELTAAAVAGALSASDAVAFAGRRGAEMAAACALTPTGMSAVLGGDADVVVAAIESAGLTAANRNGAGQIVAAGAMDALEKFAAEPPAGARVRPLSVAGAFHTHYMAPAEQALAEYTSTMPIADPRPILLSNADGAAVDTGADLLARLVRQVTLPVRWDLCLRSCSDLGVTAAIELAPAGVLAGIAKRELPGVELLAVKTPDDLERGRTLVASRPQHGQGEHTPEFRVVVTPAKGVFTRAESVTEGHEVARGTRLGTVRTNRDEHAIIANEAGVLAEWLRHDGDIVPAGLPVARLSNGSEY
ncbi:MAG: [acyl-carrier-protein] S-malonyltransferase [Pseudonocardiales bacterium]|nr:biotin attachment protein [Jatrophihabitans sp.]MDT4900363.1 [acyl-carrier-protein] S-malonyltransferase [Pseudonocardiales bacterium]MDT4905770.1 [acyl-carrier-protein] S-malonyltransferase [Pseudonocardiales bacterium]MDT4930626.1 [acyl-carrier-protein] S-malonyltransferase [Pseudonocardiales bacterium]